MHLKPFKNFTYLPCKQRFLGRPMSRRANKLLIRPPGHRAPQKPLLAGYHLLGCVSEQGKPSAVKKTKR